MQNKNSNKKNKAKQITRETKQESTACASSYRKKKIFLKKSKKKAMAFF